MHCVIDARGQRLSAARIREQLAILLEAVESVWFVDIVMPESGAGAI